MTTDTTSAAYAEQNPDTLKSGHGPESVWITHQLTCWGTHLESVCDHPWDDEYLRAGPPITTCASNELYVRGDLLHDALDRVAELEAENSRLRAATRVRMTACPKCGAGFKEFAGEAGRCENNHVVKDTWIEPLKAVSAAGWIAGRDESANLAENRYASWADNDNSSVECDVTACRDVAAGIRALTPPADDRATLDEVLKKILEPAVVRYNFDGHGWMYRDGGDGSQWLARAMVFPDAEILYSMEKLSGQ